LTGGEGGIRTLGTLIRGTHDFQSCTFNRSVTSPDEAGLLEQARFRT
jgi:hypothetical protein